MINITEFYTQASVVIELFDGACDPDFDNDLGEMERHFAECRLTLASE